MFSVCEQESLEHTKEFRDQILRVLDDETVRLRIHIPIVYILISFLLSPINIIH